MCMTGNAWVPQITLNHQIRVHLICILNNQSENAKHHKYAMGVELQGHGNLFIWHGQIWKCGYLSQNKELTLISFPLLLSLSFLPFSFFLAFFKTVVKRGTKTKTLRATITWEITKDWEENLETDPNGQSTAFSGEDLFVCKKHSKKLAVNGGKPSLPLGLGPRVTKSHSQRGPLNPFFKKEKKKKRCLMLSSSDWETPPFWITHSRMLQLLFQGYSFFL